MKSQIEFFAEVRYRLRRSQVSIAAMSEILGLARTAFYDWASGRHKIQYDTVVRVAKFLNEVENGKFNQPFNEFRHELFLNHPECEKMMKAEYLSGTKISDIAIAFDAPPDVVVKLIEKSDSVFLKING